MSNRRDFVIAGIVLAALPGMVVAFVLLGWNAGGAVAGAIAAAVAVLTYDPVRRQFESRSRTRTEQAIRSTPPQPGPQEIATQIARLLIAVDDVSHDRSSTLGDTDERKVAAIVRAGSAAASLDPRELFTAGGGSAWTGMLRELAGANVLSESARAFLVQLSSGRTPDDPRSVTMVRSLRQMFPDRRTTAHDLPPADPLVVGRTRLIADVAGRITQQMAANGTAVALLAGQPGVGTSTVALEVARTLRPGFPGGVLYFNLHGLDDTHRIETDTLIGTILAAIGSSHDDFENAMRDRGILLVLDNALDSAHVQRLARRIPTCCVLVTSRNRSQSYADPGLFTDVPPLTPAASVALLSTVARLRDGQDPPRGFTARANDIAARCAHVPLALRLVTQQIESRPTIPILPLMRLLAYQLADESTRLAHLAVGDRAVTAAINLSYAQLDRTTQRLLRMCHTIRQQDVAAAELGACLGLTATVVEDGLARLVDQSLATLSIVDDEQRPIAAHSLFTLIRLFANELRRDADAVAKFNRGFIAYLRRCVSLLIEGVAGPDPRLRHDPAPFLVALGLAIDNRDLIEQAVDLGDALIAWFAGQDRQDRIRAVEDILVQIHVKHGDHEAAVDVRLAATRKLRSTPDHTAEAPAMGHIAASLAREFDLPRCEALAEFETSLCHAELTQWPAAIEIATSAVTRLRQIDDIAATMPPMINLARFTTWHRDNTAALAWAEAAVDVTRRRHIQPNLVADAYFERATAQYNLRRWVDAGKSWDRACRTYARAGLYSGAAVAAANAALTTSDDRLRARRLDRCVRYWFQVGPRAPEHVAIARVRLSTAFVGIDDLPAALDALSNAVHDLAPTGLFPLLLLEIRVRHVVALLLDGSPHDPKWTYKEQELATEARVADRIAVVDGILDGTRSIEGERARLLRFLRSEPLNGPPADNGRRWHQEISSSQEDDSAYIDDEPE